MSNVKVFFNLFFPINSILMVRITKQTSQVKFPRESREEMNTGLALTSRNFRLWCCMVHIRYKVTLTWTNIQVLLQLAMHQISVSWCTVPLPLFCLFSEISIQKLRDYTEGDAATTWKDEIFWKNNNFEINIQQCLCLAGLEAVWSFPGRGPWTWDQPILNQVGFRRL